jgi:hypothetical protein
MGATSSLRIKMHVKRLIAVENSAACIGQPVYIIRSWWDHSVSQTQAVLESPRLVEQRKLKPEGGDVPKT